MLEAYLRRYFDKKGEVNELRTLLRGLIRDPPYRIVVFFTTARLTQLYSEAFSLVGLPVLEMHSRRSQSQRTRVADQFRDGSNLIMFSSDVSARGMDYPDVTAVIQVRAARSRSPLSARIPSVARAPTACPPLASAAPRRMTSHVAAFLPSVTQWRKTLQ